MSKSRSGNPRRVAAGILAGALTVFGFALAPPAGATADATSGRIAGATRYGTAASVAGQSDFTGATTAILATGETFPDALAASGLAGANGPTPIVLTQKSTYTKDAQDALNALPSLTDVIIVGGTGAVTQAVQDAVEADGFTVTRSAGADRYATAAAIANDIGSANIGSIGGKKTALIATGNGFADALAGGPLAYDNKMPILLVQQNNVPAATETALNDLGIEQVMILGGTAAVSDATQTDLEGIVGNPAIRAAGTDRFGTAAAVAQHGVDDLGWGPAEILLANGLNFPDALAGGPLGGARKAPILLTASVPPPTSAFADLHSDTIKKTTGLGGTGVLSDADIATVETASKDVANDGNAPSGSGTTKPELVQTTFVETRTATFATTARPAGTYIKYTFDEQITGKAPTAAKFFAYTNAGLRTAATSVTVVDTDNKSAEAYFGGAAFDTAAEAAVLTTATVDDDAVEGQAGATDPNIEGDGGITPATAASGAAAGVTDAPDLVSIGNFRAGTSGDVTAVDFTFDEAAFTSNINGYKLVDLNGAEIFCNASPDNTAVSGGTIPGGSGTTVHTVLCNEAPGAVHWTADLIARGFVNQGTVGDTALFAHPNPLEAADVTAGGTTPAPDLALVVFAPSSDTSSDVVAYFFDEAIANFANGPTATSPFAIYTDTGAENRANGAATRSTENNSAALTFVGDETLAGATYVGGSVRTGAVTDTETPANANESDEVPVSPSSGATSAADRTDGPDLTGVTINETTSPLGTVSHNVTYAFDEDTQDTSSALAATDNAAGGNSATGENVITALFHLYTADGINLVCNNLSSSPLTTADATLAARDEDHDSTVTCYGYLVGPGGAAATDTQVHAGIVGTVDYGAVDDESGTTGVPAGDTNPEGAALTTGGNGTPAT